LHGIRQPLDGGLDLLHFGFDVIEPTNEIDDVRSCNG
jgi:hypothetical protein